MWYFQNNRRREEMRGQADAIPESSILQPSPLQSVPQNPAVVESVAMPSQSQQVPEASLASDEFSQYYGVSMDQGRSEEDINAAIEMAFRDVNDIARQ